MIPWSLAHVANLRDYPRMGLSQAGHAMLCGKFRQVYDELRLLDSDDEEAKVAKWQTRRCRLNQKCIKVSHTISSSMCWPLVWMLTYRITQKDASLCCQSRHESGQPSHQIVMMLCSDHEDNAIKRLLSRDWYAWLGRSPLWPGYG